MFLGVDIGNTNISIGASRGWEILGLWRLETDRKKTPDEYAASIKSILELGGVETPIRYVVICSVVPPLNNVFRYLFNKYFSVDPLFVSPGIKTGIKINVKNPVEVGADRVVNAVAAYKIYKEDTIVIDFGTATTFDLVTGKGEFLGGVIAPGIEISMDALFSRTSKLPRVEFKCPEKVVGKSTVEALQSGIYYGYVSLVEGIVRRMKEEVGKAKVVATGGCSVMFKNLDFIDHVDPLLTMKGLMYIAAMNFGEEVFGGGEDRGYC